MTSAKEKLNRQKVNRKALADAVREWYRGHNYGPSYRDLSVATGMSLGTVYSVCQELRELGVLDFQDNVARTIKLRKKESK